MLICISLTRDLRVRAWVPTSTQTLSGCWVIACPWPWPIFLLGSHHSLVLHSFSDNPLRDRNTATIFSHTATCLFSRFVVSHCTALSPSIHSFVKGPYNLFEQVPSHPGPHACLLDSGLCCTLRSSPSDRKVILTL